MTLQATKYQLSVEEGFAPATWNLSFQIMSLDGRGTWQTKHVLMTWSHPRSPLKVASFNLFFSESRNFHLVRCIGHNMFRVTSKYIKHSSFILRAVDFYVRGLKLNNSFNFFCLIHLIRWYLRKTWINHLNCCQPITSLHLVTKNVSSLVQICSLFVKDISLHRNTEVVVL